MALVCATAVLCAIAGLLTWHKRQLSRNSAAVAATVLAQSLANRDSQSLSRLITLPPALEDKSPAERSLLTMDLLDTELSADGLRILLEQGAFGTLTKIFPEKAVEWTEPYRIPPDQCFAFKLTRNAVTAELGLHRQPDGTFRVLRCNDIRQLALPPPSP